jgi:ADP-ribose pyrophosphatase YjhB (NUDIX family)
MELKIRASAVVFHNKSLLTYLAIDPKEGKEFYFLPGGIIEENETAPESTERKTLEETGYIVLADVDSVIDREYSFIWNGESTDCLTLFFRAKLLTPIQQQKVIKAVNYTKKIVWMPKDEIQQKLSYSDLILQTVLSLI